MTNQHRKHQPRHVMRLMASAIIASWQQTWYYTSRLGEPNFCRRQLPFNMPRTDTYMAHCSQVL